MPLLRIAAITTTISYSNFLLGNFQIVTINKTETIKMRRLITGTHSRIQAWLVYFYTCIKIKNVDTYGLFFGSLSSYGLLQIFGGYF